MKTSLFEREEGGMKEGHIIKYTLVCFKMYKKCAGKQLISQLNVLSSHDNVGPKIVLLQQHFKLACCALELVLTRFGTVVKF